MARMIIVFVFIFLLTIFSIQVGKRKLPHLAFGLLFGALSQIFYLFSLLIDYFNQPFGVQWTILHYFTITISTLLFYLHFEALSNIKPPFWRFNVVFGFTIISLSFLITFFVGGLSKQTALLLMYITCTSSFSFTLSFGLKVEFKINRLVRRLENNIQLVALIPVVFGGISAFLAGIFAVFNLLDLNELLRIFPLFLLPIGIGLVVLIMNYLVHPDYIFRIPIPIHHVMLYNEGGLPVYSRQVYTPAIPTLPFDPAIVSGLFKAISSVIHDTLGKDAELGYIDAKKYQFFFAQFPDGLGTFAVITSHGTYFLKRSISDFVDSIPKEFVQKINYPTALINKYREELDPLLLKSFPYLEIQEDITSTRKRPKIAFEHERITDSPS